ncbi:MAG: glycosyltransferase involved in cell wall biosynthesis [Bacillariaceae sp.]|jgi:glycosyltransferase involved in cell wall biosynthesis
MLTSQNNNDDDDETKRLRRRNIVLLTYEFTYSPFSGNGILARSLVKSLLGWGCTVTVWCCRPSSIGDDLNNDINNNSNDNHLTSPEISQDSVRRLTVLSNIVNGKSWKCLDDQSCWKDFIISNLISSPIDEQRNILQHALLQAKNAVVCTIDWSGAVAYRSLVSATMIPDRTFRLYLNFRVYSLGITNDDDDDDSRTNNRRAWYDKFEYKAMKDADVVISLSSKDTQYLYGIQKQFSKEEQIQQKQGEQESAIIKKPIEIILPPLRQDMHRFATKNGTSEDLFLHLPDPIQSLISMVDDDDDTTHLFSKRPLITCVARQSTEKCIQRFVAFVEMAANTGILQQLNLTVVLAGAVSDLNYAQQLHKRLLRAVPTAIIIDRFLSPFELGAVFAHTILNFHPPSYDAYGMTIIEAASFGAPTVLAGTSIGAFRLLGEDACIQVEMVVDNENINNNNNNNNDNDDDNESNIFSRDSLNTITNFLTECKNNEMIWKKLSLRAQEKALGWDEESYGKKMLDTIDKYSIHENRNR